MVDFFTTQAALGGASPQKSALTGVTISNAETDTQKIDFLKFILGQLEEGEEALQKQIADQENSGIQKKGAAEEVISQKLENEKADLALLKLALLGQDVDQDLDQKLADLQIERLVLKQENRIEQLTKLVNHLTSGLPKPPQSGSVSELVQRLNQRLENLEASLASFRTGEFGAEGSPFELLIATGLNPAQLTNVTNRIEEVENKLGRELTVEDLIAGVGNIIPAPGDDNHEFAVPDAISVLAEKRQEVIEARETAEEIREAEEEIALIGQPLPRETINGIEYTKIAGKQKTILTQNNNASLEQGNQANISGLINSANTAPENSSDGDGSSFESTAEEELGLPLSNSEFRNLFGSNNNVANSQTTNTGNVQNNALLTAVQNASAQLAAAALTTDITTPTSAQLSLSETLGFDLQTGTPFNQTIQAAHLISSPTSVAGQTHQATSTVAAQITKSAESGDTSKITLRLDPSELGKVEIRLEFGKERSVTAHLIVEKPETLLMLQRDANALEKALQDAGLETSSDSLSYEMANEDHAFHSGKDNQNSQTGKTGTDLESDNGDNEEIITTNMTWDVDPETGHVHYSILA